MRWRAELSREAEEQLFRFPGDVRERMIRVIDEFEEKDDSQWKGFFRKKVGPYRIIFKKVRDHALVWIFAILIKAKDTYR